jgi:hypothetical protein
MSKLLNKARKKYSKAGVTEFIPPAIGVLKEDRERCLQTIYRAADDGRTFAIIGDLINPYNCCQWLSEAGFRVTSNKFSRRLNVSGWA